MWALLRTFAECAPVPSIVFILFRYYRSAKMYFTSHFSHSLSLLYQFSFFAFLPTFFANRPPLTMAKDGKEQDNRAAPFCALKSNERRQQNRICSSLNILSVVLPSLHNEWSSALWAPAAVACVHVIEPISKEEE